jgi:anhydro-N-acetylmuramic acid kinase
MILPKGHKSAALKPMTVAGIMSGTSGDGIDVALVRITPSADGLRLKLLSHHAVPFSKPLRSAVLGAMDAKLISTAELARLNWRLGMAYSDAIKQTLLRYPVKIALVGCHGQTIYHQAIPALYAGKKLACTWQIGEMAMLAAETGVPVVSNFRPADMVASGQGAPLVPLLDYVMFRHPSRGRVLQNLGGIGNLTAIPPAGSLTEVIAFDTGPANMLIDAVTQALFQKPYDRGGVIAARGTVLASVLESTMKHPFFSRKPPKSAGREEFGHAFAADFLKLCKDAGGRSEDVVATATALTARIIVIAYDRFVGQLMKVAHVDYLLSGGGAKNSTLLAMLREELEPLGCSIATTENAGLPPQAKEAAAFALLAYETWHRRAGNVPSATGANRPAILGDITYA